MLMQIIIQFLYLVLVQQDLLIFCFKLIHIHQRKQLFQLLGHKVSYQIQTQSGTQLYLEFWKPLLLPNFNKSNTFQIIPFQTNRKLCLPYYGFAYSDNYNWQAQKSYSTNAQGISYQINKWSNPFAPHYHQQFWIILSFNKMFSSLLCNKVRSSSQLDFSCWPRPQFQIEIQNNVYQIIQLWLIRGALHVKKELRLKVNLKNVEVALIKLMNQIIFVIVKLIQLHMSKIVPETVAYYELTIIISNSGVQIIQLLYNQILDKVQIQQMS